MSSARGPETKILNNQSLIIPPRELSLSAAMNIYAGTILRTNKEKGTGYFSAVRSHVAL
jgi:hypothetical protein